MTINILTTTPGSMQLLGLYPIWVLTEQLCQQIPRAVKCCMQSVRLNMIYPISHCPAAVLRSSMFSMQVPSFCPSSGFQNESD